MQRLEEGEKVKNEEEKFHVYFESGRLQDYWIFPHIRLLERGFRGGIL